MGIASKLPYKADTFPDRLIPVTSTYQSLPRVSPVYVTPATLNSISWSRTEGICPSRTIFCRTMALSIFTTMGGAYEHATANGNKGDFELPKSWDAAKSKLKLDTPFNFVSTDDIIGCKAVGVPEAVIEAMMEERDRGGWEWDI